MKRQTIKAKFISIMALSVLLAMPALSQTEGNEYLHGGKSKPSERGDDWEVYEFDGKDYNYYKGNPKVDAITVEKLLGHHWMGRTLEELGKEEEIYLCNMATGEYLLVGEYWGETSMTDHTGLSYKLVKGSFQTSGRGNWQAWKKGTEKGKDGNGYQNETYGYWIQPIGVKEGRCIGRMHKGDGKQGHFEHNKFLALRDTTEYDDGKWWEDNQNPGGFLFLFEPVVKNGKQCYIIYTHRSTAINLDNNGLKPSDNRATYSEYWDRESYLLLRSNGKMSADFNSVRFKKFAGQMYGKFDDFYDGSDQSRNFNDDRDNPIGDELDYYDPQDESKRRGYVFIEDGLREAAQDDNNLWKIVTAEERRKFRLVASEEHPVDVSHRITNPKFYTSFNYNLMKSKCTWDSSNSQWKATNWNENTEYGWTWYARDTDEEHSINPHVHPYDLASGDNGYYDPNTEFHKVGTGSFYRFGGEGLEPTASNTEHLMTYGHEANYSGSIYNGTSNLQQTITGLREGLYVVFVRGFFAPHDMAQYQVSDGKLMCGDYDTSSKAKEDWYNGAKYGEGEFHGGSPTAVYRRSHDSYLFAWSSPNGNQNEQEEVRRMLPSIYEGAVKAADLGLISKESLISNKDEFEYTQLGNWYYNDEERKDNPIIKAAVEWMRDQTIFAKFNGTFLGESNDTWVVPKTVTGAARFFNAIGNTDEATTHRNVNNYRIGLPVYVGSDGHLTIGIDHTYAEGHSGDNEWVCFDDFELIYMGKSEPDEFIIDELHGTQQIGPFPIINGQDGTEEKDENGNTKYSKATTQKNNTQWKDIFSGSDIMNEGKDSKIVKNVVIRRTMTTGGWNSIVLPVSLTRTQIEAAFGKNTKVSQLKGITGPTITYSKVDDGMTAGVPYIINPSDPPIIAKDADITYDRRAFSEAMSTSTQDVVGHYLIDPDRNYEVERSMKGPIYIIEDVDIKTSESFPGVQMEQYTDDNKTTLWREVSSAEQDYTKWTEIKPAEVNDLVVRYNEALGKFTLRESAFYESQGEGGIPAYSYYHSGGKMYYTSKPLKTSRGLFSYLQLIHQGGELDGQPYNQPFIGFDFIEVKDDEPTGIVDINNSVPNPDGKIEIYDLQGRKVANPTKGIYILNGQKVLFK